MGGALAIKIEGDPLERVDTLFKLFPKEVKARIRDYLNDQAFAFKQKAPDILARRFTIRDPGFVKRVFQVEKAAFAKDYRDMFARVGSASFRGKYGGRFTGWIEQQEGWDDRESVWTIAARGGSAAGKIKGAFIPRNQNTPADFNLPAGIPDYLRRNALLDRILRARGVTYTKGGKGSQRKRGVAAGSGKYGVFDTAKTITFITGKGRNRGVYTVSGLGREGGRLKWDAIEPVKLFRPPTTGREFDWRGETLKEVRRVFSEGLLWREYVYPAAMAAARNAFGGFLTDG
jgi:hypothetical protein